MRKSSQQVRTQQDEFHQLEVLHRNITQSISSGLLTVSPNGQVLFSNDAAQRILDLTSEHLVGAPFKRIFPTLDVLIWPDATATTAQDGPQAPARKEVIYRRPAGEELCLGYSVSFLKKDNGAKRGWVFVFQDLTRLKSMEEHLQRLERMAYAGKMTAEIAHEIRNPLAAISGAAQMLQIEMAHGSFHAKLMNIVFREVQRIDNLITDFLWLAKGSQRSGRIEEVSVCALIEELFALLKAGDKLTDDHRLEKVFEAMPVFVMDPQHLRQVLWHLMVNAVEAMPDGGVLTVRVAAPKASPAPELKTLIEIADMGPGIPEADRDRVFEPFFSTRKGGTGLGLSIVYQVMETLGGQVELKSAPESGTSFTLFFPFDPVFPLAKQPPSDY